MAPPRTATFSIVARDSEKDAVGVAVHSKFISVGSVVPWARADAGAVATQSFANVEYGPEGLALLEGGHDAAQAVRELTAEDEEVDSRQVGVVGRDGSVAAFTGEECLDYAGDRQGVDYTVQGNVLEGPETLDAMAETFEGAEGGLPERMLAALQAGNEAGGDSRGEQGAALYVARPCGGYDGGNDRWIDVRVDDHESPIDELERVFRVYDVTLLSREAPEDLRRLEGPTAEAVLETLADLGHYDGDPGPEFGEAERDALESFRGMNNFENHGLAVVEDALARGWADAEGDGQKRMVDPDGDGQERMVDAIWHGLQRLDRK